jgi:hypothetical protein
MSLSDTLITNGNPCSIIFKDILRPANTQNLGGGFTSGTYRAVNISDPIISPGIQMFYVEVFNVTSNANSGSAQLPFPAGLVFTYAYVVLQDLTPSAKLRLFLTWGSNIYLTFQIRAITNVSNVNASFLVIGISP